MKSEIRYVTEVRRGVTEGEGTADPCARKTPIGTPEWWTHPEWESRFPWLVQGTTARVPGTAAGDFALFRKVGSPAPRQNWLNFAESLGFASIAHARQVHGRAILLHEEVPEGLSLGPDADGHLTLRPNVLMAVTVADCVPVFLVDPYRKAGGILHAGWRGVVAGMLEAGITGMVEKLGSRPDDLFLHLGPSICGDCYEVGPEVHAALGRSVPGGPEPVDLRSVLVDRALRAGLNPPQITRSAHCTLCGGSPFFSHRGGDPERQIGFLGIPGGRE